LSALLKKREMNKFIEIEYRFEWEGDRKYVHKVRLDPLSLKSARTDAGELPGWTDLAFHQCPNCPLEIEPAARCPAAASMAGLVAQFSDLLSCDRISVKVAAEERVTCSRTTVQRGVCSLMGLLMATSGCPLTTFFKPMARYHLPFSSTEETLWRATALYLVAQYFRQGAGGASDLDFSGLSAVYNQIQIVNQAFARRLRSACQHDCMINAIILLDVFARSMPSAIKASLEQIRHLFIPYLRHALSPEKMERSRN
jgi:hypothetical protein